MIGAARYLEGLAFIALAAALHLLLFWNDPRQGEIAGGSGGAATVSMIGADADMTAMVEAWETAPEAPSDIAEMEAPDQPEAMDVAVDAMTEPETITPTDAPPLAQPAIEAPRPQTEAPAVTTTLPSPPEAIAPPVEPAPEPLAGLALPPKDPQLPEPSSMTAPAQPERMAVAPIEDASPNPPEAEPEATLAPKAAPAPRAKPAAPPKPVQRAQPKRAQPNPTQSAETRPAPPSPEEGEGPAPDAVAAAGSGGGAQEGAGTAEVSVGVSAEERANMMQVWGGEIRREVDRKKKRPRAIRRAGVAKIALTIARDGGLVAARVQQSSGSDGLDAAALKAVKAAAPFNRAPDKLENPQYSFVLPIRFER